MRIPRSAMAVAPAAEQLVPFQIVMPDGRAVAERVAALGLPAEKLLQLYRGMLTIRLMDERLLTLQRQGRISFYGEARGQEAAIVGTAAALQTQDYIVPALREAGAAIYRGLPLTAYISQLFGNANDLAKGRQMPCHPGSRASRYVTMSSCIGTQLPHATGMAMAARLRGDNMVVVGYMGDGATSEGDFHVALNFAGVFRAPVVFVCQNNQWAISTPVGGQTAAATMAQKALAYGIPALRVDGNDVLAVHAAAQKLVAEVRGGGGPRLLHAITYRVKGHVSVDAAAYRDPAELQEALKTDPIARARQQYLALDGAEASTLDAIEDAARAEVEQALARADAAPWPDAQTAYTDIQDTGAGQWR